MKNRNDIIRGMFALLFLAAIYFILSEVEKPPMHDVEIPTLVSNEPPPAVTAKNEPSPEKKGETKEDLPKKIGRLDRFEAIRKKVVLNGMELAEKERILSDLKTVQWAESYLSTAPKDGSELKGHLSAIDYLEEAIAWKENPVRADALTSIENAIKANHVRSPNKDVKRLVVGDKIELFTVLAQEEPSKARALLNGAEDQDLRDVLNYAIKRLSLSQKISEDQ
jgi:hypothetical protein